MAPPGKRGGTGPARPRSNQSSHNRNQSRFQSIKTQFRAILKNYVNLQFLQRLIVDPGLLWVSAVVLFIAELVVNVLVIQRVPYTEIDWIAYMQEVEGVVNGTFDYSQLKGDTGPLVYPAGFVYLFTVLYYITNHGSNIKLAQYIFAGFYLINLALVFRIYARSKKIPPYVLLFICCTSYRIHSIYILRLFNDPVAMIFLYAAINLFIEDYWSLGSLFYSLAVSIKMNILLFAPALLLAYIASQGMMGTIKQLSICAGVQVILAVPFLMTNPVAYLKGAFDLGRVFLFEWTVNWRFLPEEIFVHRGFHLALLLIHMAVLVAFSQSWFRSLKAFVKLLPTGVGIVSQLFLLPMFSANLIGVTFSRSLHYQFYVWYFHSLPYLLWATTYSTWLRLCLLGIIEMCWNTYPSTAVSSAALHLCHVTILWGLYRTRNPSKDLNFPLGSKSQ